MRFSASLLTVTSLGLVTPITANPLAEDGTLAERAAPVCGVAGLKVKVPMAISLAAANVTPLGCLAFCKTKSACKSYGVGNKQCWLFSSPATSNFVSNAKSAYSFFDVTCDFATPVMTFRQRPSPTTYTPGDPANSPPPQTPDPVPENSPDLVVPDSVPPPADPAAFVESYTYSEGPLPTPVAMGTPPNYDGLPAPTAGLPAIPSCNIDPNDSSKQFNLAGSNFNPVLASGTTGLVPMTAPTSEAHARSMGWPGEPIIPNFYFQKPSGAPAGIYDLVMAGTPPRYVAKYNNGVVLTDSSTGTAGATRGGKKLYTSVFQVSCIGRVTAMQGTQQYAWDVSGAALAFTAGATNKSMVATPLRAAAASRSVRRGLSISNSSMVGLPLEPHDLLRRSTYNSGQAPRCPNVPDRLVSRTKWDAPVFRGISDALGCFAVEQIGDALFDDYFPPPENMDECCEAQAQCFSDCRSGVFEECNSEVDTCMSSGCQIFKEHWWLYLFYGICKLSAIAYSELTKTVYGRIAWTLDNAIYCSCNCPTGEGLCNNAGEGLTCKNLYTSDTKNCGACGRTCPENSRCAGGTCTCLKDKCGDKCLSLLDNPYNCGSCGNVCASEYCWQGKCYDPPPCNFHGIENHDFKSANNGDNPWVFTSDISDPNPSAWISSGSAANLFLRYPTNQGAHYNQFEKEVEICPGKSYKLEWTNYRDGGSDQCTISMYVGDRKVGTQTLGAWDDDRNGPLQQNDTPKLEPAVDVAPFSFADAKRDNSGIRRNGLSLYAKVKGYVSCDGNCGTDCSRTPGGFDYYTTVRFGDVQMFQA